MVSKHHHLYIYIVMFFNAVIGFSTDNLELQERIEELQYVYVELLTSANVLVTSVQNSYVDVTVTLNDTALNSTLGRLHEQYYIVYVQKHSVSLIA